MVDVLELGVAVDPALDPDIALLTGPSQADRLGDGHKGSRGEQATDAVARSEAPQDRQRDREGSDTCGRKEEGSHAGIIRIAGNQRARRNLPNTWALM